MSAGYPACAANDPNAPYARGMSVADEQAIAKRAEELAAEGFDARDDRTNRWLTSQVEDGDMMAILDVCNAAIDEDIDAMRLAKDRLRARFVYACSRPYRAQAEREILQPESCDAD